MVRVFVTLVVMAALGLALLPTTKAHIEVLERDLPVNYSFTQESLVSGGRVLRVSVRNNTRFRVEAVELEVRLRNAFDEIISDWVSFIDPDLAIRAGESKTVQLTLTRQNVFGQTVENILNQARYADIRYVRILFADGTLLHRHDLYHPIVLRDGANIISAFEEMYPEISQASLGSPGRIRSWGPPRSIVIDGAGYSIDLYPFSLAPDGEEHIFARLIVDDHDRAMPRGRSYPMWYLMLQWNDDAEMVEIVQLDGDPPLHDTIWSVEPIRLDNVTSGVGLGLASGAGGRNAAYVVLEHQKSHGFRLAWQVELPGDRVDISDEEEPAQITFFRFKEWGEDFPINDLTSLDMVSLSHALRLFKIVSHWDGETFVEQKPQEIMRPVAVINHFLRSVDQGDLDVARRALTPNLRSQLDFVNFELSQHRADRLLVLVPHEAQHWAENLGYVIPGELVGVAVIGDDRKRKPAALLKPEDTEMVVFFQLTGDESLLIRQITVLHRTGR